MGDILLFLYKAVALLLSGLYSIGLPVRVHGKPLAGRITVTAHSGCLGLADNSIEAMDAGVEAGAQIVEFDLNYAADGTPLLSHDSPQEGETYVTLAQAFAFLQEHPNVQANVDVKNTAYLEKVPELAAQAGVTEQIFFTGIEEKDVAAVQEKCPGIPYYLNAGVSEEDDLNALAEKVAALGAVGLNTNWNNVTPELIRVFHKNGMPVSVWTVNEPKAVYRMALYGADNITTRSPDIVCSLIR